MLHKCISVDAIQQNALFKAVFKVLNKRPLFLDSVLCGRLNSALAILAASTAAPPLSSNAEILDCALPKLDVIYQV
jgi:hypothetical protein